MTDPRKIIIDCDPGIDDAVALMLATASPALDLVAVTAVHGNKPISTTVANARRVLDLVGADDVPVYQGAARPLLLDAVPDNDYYGADGLGDVGLPPASREPDPGIAAEKLVEIVMAAPEKSITVCPIGPMTNLALAMRLEGRFAGRLSGVCAMGGDFGHGPKEEFNVRTDPAAVDIVLRSGAALTLVPYDVTRILHADDPTLATLAASGDRRGEAAAAMERQRNPVGSALHDPCAIAALIDPGLITSERGTIRIEWRDQQGEGITEFEPADDGPHRLVRSVDHGRLMALLIALLTDQA